LTATFAANIFTYFYTRFTLKMAVNYLPTTPDNQNSQKAVTTGALTYSTLFPSVFPIMFLSVLPTLFTKISGKAMRTWFKSLANLAA